MHPTLDRVDRRIERGMDLFGHTTHAAGLGVVFVWFGALKVFGEETATSLIAKTIYLGSPETMVPILGLWEIAIGVTIVVRPLRRLALLLLALRLPGTLLALALKSEACFVDPPWVPTIAGQYLLKDVVLLSAAAVVGGRVRRSPTLASGGSASPG